MPQEDDAVSQDIDAGIEGLAQEKTAAELLKEKGQHRKFKVIKKDALKGFILEALKQVMSDNSEHLTEQERDKLLAEAEARVNQLRAEAEEREASQKQRAEQAEARLQEMQAQHLSAEAAQSASVDELRTVVERLQSENLELLRKNANAEEALHAREADVMVIESDLETSRKILQTTIQERDKSNEMNRTLMQRP